jgi:hypothetical protein
LFKVDGCGGWDWSFEYYRVNCLQDDISLSWISEFIKSRLARVSRFKDYEFSHTYSLTLLRRLESGNSGCI